MTPRRGPANNCLDHIRCSSAFSTMLFVLDRFMETKSCYKPAKNTQEG